jgi:hypothetical protein
MGIENKSDGPAWLESIEAEPAHIGESAFLEAARASPRLD